MFVSSQVHQSDDVIYKFCGSPQQYSSPEKQMDATSEIVSHEITLHQSNYVMGHVCVM